MGWAGMKDRLGGLLTIRDVDGERENHSEPAFGASELVSSGEKDQGGGNAPVPSTSNGAELQTGELSHAEDTAGGMGRHLGLMSTTFLIVGRIIGTGIFSTPSSITSSVGSVGAALMLWVLGLVISFCGLFVWLELGCMFPRSGGEKNYLEAAYRHPRFFVTVVFAVQAILLGFTAAGCIVFAQNIIIAADKQPSEWAKRGIAIAVITFVTIIHTFYPKWGVRLMNLLSSIKVFILVFIVVTGWVVLGGGVNKVRDPHASFRNAFVGSALSGNLYATALFKVLNSYAGWNNAALVLNEVKRPVQTLRVAGPLGLGICGVLYILANVSYFAAATPAEIKLQKATVASYFFRKVFGHTAQRALSVFVGLSSLSNVLTVTFAQARVNQELAKEGVIPYQRFWASTWPAGSPSAGLLLHFIPSFIVIIAVPFGDAYNFILDVEGYPLSVINALVVIGFFVLRWQAKDVHRPFRVWWPIALFFLASQSFLIVAPFLRPPDGKGDTSLPYWLYPIVGIVVLLCGCLYWWVWRKAMPWLGNYHLEQRKVTLADGTVVTTFDRVKNE